jgi:hypothetical protein
MKIGIMQPYFFPYLGYFSIIKYTDKWIVFDVVQFIRHGWIERNRILKPEEGWQYICVPLEKHKRDTFIKDIRIRSNELWKEKIISQIQHYKRRAPYFKEVINVLQKAFIYDTVSITCLNTHLLKKICEYLNIDLDLSIYSEMNLDIEPVNAPDEWALNISKALNANEYVNPPGGVNFFNRNKYRESGIKLTFLKILLTPYNQNRNSFEPGLSILDVMMFNTPDEINKMIDNFEIV